MTGHGHHVGGQGTDRRQPVSQHRRPPRRMPGHSGQGDTNLMLGR